MTSEIEYLRERNAELTEKYEELTKECTNLHRELRMRIMENESMSIQISMMNHPTSQGDA